MRRLSPMQLEIVTTLSIHNPSTPEQLARRVYGVVNKASVRSIYYYITILRKKGAWIRLTADGYRFWGWNCKQQKPG